MLGSAKRSPSVRGVSDIQSRVERLERYEAAFTPMKLNLQEIAGNELWKRHWERRDIIVQALEESKSISDEMCKLFADYIEDMISATVKQRLIPILTSGMVPSDEIERLKDEGYCSEQFGITYPLLIELHDSDDPAIRATDQNGKLRYYVDPITINGISYLVTSQWYKRHRTGLENWLTAHAVDLQKDVVVEKPM